MEKPTAMRWKSQPHCDGETFNPDSGIKKPISDADDDDYDDDGDDDSNNNGDDDDDDSGDTGLLHVVVGGATASSWRTC